MALLPLALNLQEHRCLVVGGGKVALRKLDALLEAGATVDLVAPGPLSEALQQRLSFHSAKFSWLDGRFPDDGLPIPLADYTLAVAATDDSAVNALLADRCRVERVLCNQSSDSFDGDAILPAVVKRGGISCAIHSDTANPAFTRYLKHTLAALIPASLDVGLQWLNGLRDSVKNSGLDKHQQRRLWTRVFASDGFRRAQNADFTRADDSFTRQLSDSLNGKGEVFLVGAGPGDPELLTLKALKLIGSADVVLYDRLVSPEIMAMLPEQSEKIYVGKRRSEHAVPQMEINEMLLSYANKGRNVLRLKGGDPFIFGRGGEEIELLAEAGIAFQVVPGITAASGCSCYGGIPLTHRDYSQSVRFVTGHLKEGSTNLDWPELARPHQTLVFYMGLQGLASICATLVAHGLPASTPAALVEKGTTAQQRVITGTLSNLPQTIAEAQVAAPTLLIVGEVVTLHDRLQWFSGAE